MMPSFLESVVGWLREGYPQGVPEHDYLPLFALLRRRLTDDEVASVVKQLEADGSIPADAIDIGALITKITAELPYEADIDRVREHLPQGL
jgi:hypothetical protein